MPPSIQGMPLLWAAEAVAAQDRARAMHNLAFDCHFLATVFTRDVVAGWGARTGNQHEISSQRGTSAFLRWCTLHGDRAHGGELGWLTASRR
jgi:hypothetical protein